MIWFCNCFPIHVLIGSTSNLLKLEDLGSILIGCVASVLSVLSVSILTSEFRMQHFGQNKELGVPPVNIFRSCHENRNVACSKFLGVSDKNVHGSIESVSINV